MREGDINETKPAKKKPSSFLLREKLGGVPKAALELSRENTKLKKQIKALLKERPYTVPELFAATHIPIEKVLWHVMSLKKYGEVVEGDEKDSYVEYVLKSKEEKAS